MNQTQRTIPSQVAGAGGNCRQQEITRKRGGRGQAVGRMVFYDRGGLGFCLAGQGRQTDRRLLEWSVVGQAQGTSGFESECLLAKKKKSQTFATDHAMPSCTTLTHFTHPCLDLKPLDLVFTSALEK